MSISLSLPRTIELKPRIVVIGVGGAGGNAVNNMIGSGLDGVEFVVANTDAQALALSKADRKVQLGGGITQGLGAGMRPEIGEQSAEESLDEILEHLEGAHMLFVAAGMGGGTGTGAAPVIARAARERGILTVGIVTKPFMFEGTKRMKLADQGIENLYGSVDTMITIPNQNLFRVATDQTTMTDAFAMADEVLHSGVRGVTDLMVVPGLINLDFNDVRTVMDEMGKAMMGTGEATGDRRAIEAAEAAINNPLLDDVSLKGAKGVLINITGGSDLTLYEVDEAANLIRSQVDEDANIIVGSALESDLDGIVRVSVVATGVETEYAMDSNPAPTRRLKEVAKGFEKQEVNYLSSTENIYNEVNKISSFDDREFNNLELESLNTKNEETIISQNTGDHLESLDENLEKDIVSEIQPQNVVKKPFGFFGLKKPKMTKQPIDLSSKSKPVQQDVFNNEESLMQSGDLFGDSTDEELEIPSFLRRQNN